MYPAVHQNAPDGTNDPELFSGW